MERSFLDDVGAVAVAVFADPLCASPVRVRTVITPDPLIPTPIAATACPSAGC